MNTSLKRALFAHALCKYDIFLFGFLASIIKPLFFPSADIVSSLAVFATFASGYLIRPLGGIFFSHIGDRMGRKNAFSMTILFILFPSFVIGILPSYETLGLLAPIILITARIIQGFGAGGEASGVMTYGCELSALKSQGFTGGVVRSVGFLSTAIGTGIAAFLTLSFMPEWSWRIAFILGASMSGLSYYLRKKMVETEDFSFLKENNKILRAPILHTIKGHKSKTFAIFLVSACAYSFLYFTAIYLNSLYTDKLGTNPSSALLISSMMLLIWAVLTPLSGYFADRVGIINYLKKLVIPILFILPVVFFTLMSDISFSSLLSLHIILSICGSLFFGPVPALFKVVFPTSIRYTGTALGSTLAQVSIGSLTPFYATLIFSFTDSLPTTGIILCLTSVMGLMGLILCERIAKRESTEERILADIIYSKKHVAIH